ncbi:hypothetical protein KQI61_15310 [Anaerocolumna aminovalerica]|uniref:phage lytic cycle repressor MrpR family protein n=1 Tax=Anaerocolumna aminovalerica TaxID=1527 RepID=UPI001C0EB142|nr:hypothetical protein [Anaerocolumna aminovalerica]MBU5333566.1 hypothetical protein [Anaerocolumna aminovalerica]
MNEYYNHQRKKDYLKSQELDFNTNIIKNIISVFNMTSNFENANDKDLCEFTFEEFVSMFSLNQWVNYSTFKSKKTIIKNYIKYCVDNNLCEANNLRNISRLIGKDIKKKSKFEIEYYKDFEDFHDTIQYLFHETLKNNDNGVISITILYLLWYGFEKEEIIKIKNEDFDFDNKTIMCRDTNHIVNIDNEDVLSLFQKCKDYRYISRWHNRYNKILNYEIKNPRDFIKSDRIESLSVQNLRVRIGVLNDIIKDNNNMLSKYVSKKIVDYGISTSGLYYRIKLVEDNNNIQLELSNIELFNKLLNNRIPYDLTNGYDFLGNYKEWKKFFYGI